MTARGGGDLRCALGRYPAGFAQRLDQVRHGVLRLGADFAELIKDRFLLGSPDEVAEQMLTLHRTTGINHLIMSAQWPGMPQSLVREELHLLAEEVFPRVRQG